MENGDTMESTRKGERKHFKIENSDSFPHLKVEKGRIKVLTVNMGVKKSQ